MVNYYWTGFLSLQKTFFFDICMTIMTHHQILQGLFPARLRGSRRNSFHSQQHRPTTAHSGPCTFDPLPLRKAISTAYGKRDACTAGCKAAGRQSSTGEHLYFSEFGCPSWIVSYSHILVAVIFYHQHVWKNRENHTHLTAAKGKPRDGTTQ